MTTNIIVTACCAPETKEVVVTYVDFMGESEIVLQDGDTFECCVYDDVKVTGIYERDTVRD